MASDMVFSTFAVIVLATSSCHGYGLGAPTDFVCGEGFPDGHLVNSRTDAAPFEIIVNQATYSPGDTIEIQLNAKTDTRQPDGRLWFYEGVVVQVRSRNCNNLVPVGTFSVQANENFLQPVECFDNENSAIRHFSHDHIYNRTFYWTAPATAVNHVFVRATVARNKNNFWTNVFSEVIVDPTDPTNTTGLSPCPVRTEYISPFSCPTSATTRISLNPAVLLVGLLLLCVR